MTNDNELTGTALEAAHFAVDRARIRQGREALAALADQLNPDHFTHAFALDQLARADDALLDAELASKAAQSAITAAHVALQNPQTLFPAQPITEGGDEPDAADHWKK